MNECKNTYFIHRIFLEYVSAICIRFGLLFFDFNSYISNRIELSTPLNSWKRVLEGVVLYNEGINPYSGDLFHETPVDLVIFKWLLDYASPIIVDAVFVFCDVSTAHILHKTAKLYLQQCRKEEDEEKGTFDKEAHQLLLDGGDCKVAPLYVLSAYLLNPYIVFNCAARTTNVFSNLLLSLVLFTMIKGQFLICCVVLAYTALRSFYPFILIVPVCLVARKKYPNKISRTIVPVFYFLFSLLFLFFVSFLIVGDWSFIEPTIMFILTVPDLKPNVGLFWYFFTEMFEHFRPLFLWSFQINATVLYLTPLSIRFNDDPMLLSFSLISLSAVFKSYSSISDVGFYMAMIPIWSHLMRHMQQGFMVFCFFIGCSVLGPTVWHLWIYAGSANANFYFGVTLAFATTQIFLFTDVLFAYTKREFTLRNGFPKPIDNVEYQLTLQ